MYMTTSNRRRRRRSRNPIMNWCRQTLFRLKWMIIYVFFVAGTIISQLAEGDLLMVIFAPVVCALPALGALLLLKGFGWMLDRGLLSFISPRSAQVVGLLRYAIDSLLSRFTYQEVHFTKRYWH